MNQVSRWVMSIAGVAILGVLIDLIMPEGSTKKYIKSIMSIITLFIILLPIPALLNKNWNYSQFFNGNEIQADRRIVDNVNSQQISLLEDSLENKLSMDGFRNAKIKLTTVIENNALMIKAVSVDVTECEIKKDTKTLERVKETIKKYLNNTDITVIVYG